MIEVTWTCNGKARIVARTEAEAEEIVRTRLQAMISTISMGATYEITVKATSEHKDLDYQK